MKRVLSIFSRKQTTIGSAAFVLMSMVFASRVLGLIRDRLLAARFVPDELGVYFAAFRLPNFLFELLVMGILTSAFIPVFTKYLTKSDEKGAWRMASSLINISLGVLLLLSIPVFVFTKQISQFLAPGFSSSQIEQMTSFTRFMIFFQVIPLMVGNLFTGMLQSYNIFLLPALAPVVYNIGIIIGIVALTPMLGLNAPVVGVGLGAFLFLFIQVPSLVFLGYRHQWVADTKDPGVKEVGKLMAPRTLGLAISQIDSTVDLILSSLLGARMVTFFTFAQQLQQLPVGLFGATIAQAALPSLSVSSASENRDQFKTSIISAMHQILFFVLPTSALFIVLRIPVVRLVFGSNRFDWQATVLTGATLSAFSISLFAQALIHVLARGFYALYDSKTPVIVGVVAIVTNTVLSILFIQGLHLSIWSLGLSTSIASITNVVLLFILLDRRIQNFPRRDLFVPAGKMLIAASITGVMLYVPLKLLDQLVFDTTRTFNLILLTGISGAIGLSTYLFLSWVMGVGEVQSFLHLIQKVRGTRKILLNPANEVVNGGIQDKLS